MIVKDVIEWLNEFDEKLEVYVRDEIEGNDCPLRYIEIGKKPNDDTKECLMIMW